MGDAVPTFDLETFQATIRRQRLPPIGELPVCMGCDGSRVMHVVDYRGGAEEIPCPECNGEGHAEDDIDRFCGNDMPCDACGDGELIDAAMIGGCDKCGRV